MSFCLGLFTGIRVSHALLVHAPQDPTGSCTSARRLGPVPSAEGARLPTMTLLDRVLACWQRRVVGGLRGPRGTRKSGTATGRGSGIGGSVRPGAGLRVRVKFVDLKLPLSGPAGDTLLGPNSLSLLQVSKARHPLCS